MWEKHSIKSAQIMAVTLAAVLFSMLFSVRIGYCAGSLESMKSGFLNLLDTVRKIGTMFAAIALAINAIIMAVGQDTAKDKAKTAMIYVIIAAAALYLVPAFFRIGVENFGLSWDPRNPGA